MIPNKQRIINKKMNKNHKITIMHNCQLYCKIYKNNKTNHNKLNPNNEIFRNYLINNHNNKINNKHPNNHKQDNKINNYLIFHFKMIDNKINNLNKIYYLNF